MNCRFAVSLLCFAFSAVLAAAPVSLDVKGRLDAAGLLFCGDNYANRRNCTQGSAKEWKLDKLERDPKAGLWSSAGEVLLSDSEKIPFSGELRRVAENQYTYDFTLRNVKYNFTLRAAIPANTFAGRSLVFDGKPFRLPLEKKNLSLSSGSARKIEIPCDNGSLVIESGQPVYFNLHDYRPGTKTFSLLMRMQKTEESVRELHLKLTYRPYSSTPLDLRKAVNMGFRDETASDGKGGWTDQGPENDLRMLKPGLRMFHGTEFDIIDPAKNGGRSCLVLAGVARDYMPVRAETAVAQGIKGRWLFLLHATAWGTSAPELGKVTLTYGDGTTETIRPRNGYDVGNWWGPSPRANGEVVWTGENRSSYVGLYRSVYPVQEKEIRKVEFESANRAVWMIVAASVGNERPPRFMSVPFYITAGKDWKPVDFFRDVLPGSVLDFSGKLDAPAGKHGPVVIRNGHFEFRGKPGVPQRFYGTNLCSAGPFLPREWAERFADRMAQYGFNIVRIHHHDGGIGRKDRTYELDTEKNDRLDYLIYCLKKRGIYLTADLYISRRLPAGEIPEYPGRLTNIGSYKAMFWILDSVWENWKTHVRNYLAHVNPYTGVALKDDPVLVSVSIINEGNIKSCWASEPFTRKLYEERFAQWRAANNLPQNVSPGEHTRQFERFLTETYEKRYAQMTEFVRSLGLKCPLTDQNMGTTPKLSQMRREYDYVDVHGYSNHPAFARTPWKLPSLSGQTSALAGSFPVPWHLASSRLFGKPFAVTEWDYAYPNRFRAEGAPVIGAYGGLQGWDMLVQFAYSHGQERIMKEDAPGSFFDIAVDPVKSLGVRIGGALFSQNGIPPADKAFAVRLTAHDEIPFETPFNGSISLLGQIARVGVVVGENAEAEKLLPPDTVAILNPGTAFPKDSLPRLPVFDAAPGKDDLIVRIVRAGLIERKNFESENGIFRSLDGRIELNRKAQTFRAVSDVCEAFVLPAGRSGKGDFLSAKSLAGRGVIAAVSTDNRPLKETDRILLLHLTDSHRTKTRFASSDMKQLDSWGTPPYLAARGEAEITLSPEPGTQYRLFAVNTAGKRLNEIPLVRKNDGLGAILKVFQPSGTVFAYELQKIK